MAAKRSTLLTSPVSFADFVFRLAFFALAPFAIVIVAQLFPVRGALLDVGLALLVFASSEAAHRLARRWRAVDLVIAQALEFESFYVERPPRAFAYYVFYPLLFPYWLASRTARREFLVFRSYTLASLGLLLGSLIWQYFRDWPPELQLIDYLPFVLASLLVETLLVLALLMPIATTIVWYHSSFRRGRLAMLLLAGLLSTGLALAKVISRRDPVVSYATRERVRLRTERSPREAHRALLQAVRASLAKSLHSLQVDSDGIMEGAPLEAARDALERFYKHDEAYAFNLWASPRNAPRLLVLYFEARPHRRPIWVALGADGNEISAASDLPRGAFHAMRQAEGDDAALWSWPQELLDDDALFGDPTRPRSRARHKPGAAPAPAAGSPAAPAAPTPAAAGPPAAPAAPPAAPPSPG
jgi:hypothetical protein